MRVIYYSQVHKGSMVMTTVENISLKFKKSSEQHSYVVKVCKFSGMEGIFRDSLLSEAQVWGLLRCRFP